MPAEDGLRQVNGAEYVLESRRAEGIQHTKKPRVAGPGFGIQSKMKATCGKIFDEKYRVVAVESQSLTIRGVSTGEVLTILNPDPETPLTPAEYPPGKLIALSDPSAVPGN